MSKKINPLYPTFIITIIFIVLLITFPDISIEHARNGIILWYKSILPTMLPFLIFALFASKIGISDFLAQIFSKPFEKILKINGYGAFAIICAMISGYPAGAKIVSELIYDNKISINQAKKIFVCANITSPAFITGAVANDMFGCKNIGFIMVLSHYVSAFILCTLIKDNTPYICANKNISIKSSIRKLNSSYIKQHKTLADMFSDSIVSASQTLISICCFIVIFSISSGFINELNIMPSMIMGDNFKLFDCILISAIEMTNGCKMLSESPTLINSATACAMISFGGFCIHFQILSVISKSGIKPSFVFITKTLHALLSFFIFFIFSFIIKL